MKTAAEMRQRARQYRRLATELTNRRLVDALAELAALYEAAADRIIVRGARSPCEKR